MCKLAKHNVLAKLVYLLIIKPKVLYYVHNNILRMDRVVNYVKIVAYV